MKRLRASIACGTFFLGVCVVPGTTVRATVGPLETGLERGSDLVSQLIVSYEQDVALTESPMTATGSALIGEHLTPGLDIGLGMTTVLLDRAVSVSEARKMAVRLTADPRIEWAEPDLQMSVPSDVTPSLTPAVPQNTMATSQSVPGFPTKITLKPFSGRISVSWVKPVNQGTSAITSYTVRAYSSSSSGSTVASCVTTSKSCEITGLSNGSTYWISVAAKNSSGTGSPSPRVSGTPPLFKPNDPIYVKSELWGLNDTYGVQAQKAWLATRGNPEIVVAVLDTGSTEHPDLVGQTVPGYDMIINSGIAGDGDGRDSDPSDQGDWEDGCGQANSELCSSWHGTHVAGIINALGNNSLGVIGVASRVKVQHVRVLGRGGGFDSDIIAGIIWASGGTVGEGVGALTNPTPARVINLSLGGESACSLAYQTAINDAIFRGTVVVAAAGNAGADASTTAPANCNGVITVGASKSDGGQPDFSNDGPLVDIAAPGEGIKSTMNAGLTGPGLPTYALKSGTSMATPYVAGIVALMLSVDPSLTPAEVEVRIKNQDNQTFLVQGVWGIINAARLLGVPEIPQSPTNVVAIRSGPATITTTRTVSWSAATSGSVATTHIARAYLRPSGESPVMWCSTANLACDLSNMVKGATYYLDVISGNTGGYSAPSGLRIAINTKGSVASVVPTLTTGPTKGSIKVSWASGLQSSLMDSYLIQYSTDLLSWKDGAEVEINSPTLVSGLKSGVNYRFRVVSKKDSGSFIKISRESAQMKPN